MNSLSFYYHTVFWASRNIPIPLMPGILLASLPRIHFPVQLMVIGLLLDMDCIKWTQISILLFFNSFAYDLLHWFCAWPQDAFDKWDSSHLIEKYMCIFAFSLCSLHHQENMPELACWRMWEIRGTEPSHASWRHPRPATWQPTWQRIVDAWESLAKASQDWCRVGDLPSVTTGWWEITNGCCLKTLGLGVAHYISIAN